MSAIEIMVQPTPNPNALKFLVSIPMKTKGNSTYYSPVQCGENNLASLLFDIRGVDQLHFYDNSITLTKFTFAEWEDVESKAMEIIQRNAKDHNPDYYDPDPEGERREALPEELKKIESIFDRTIRPGLQGDGGDIQTISLEDNILLVKYQGACGTCPASTTGTLEAIRGILRDEYSPDIQVYIAPEY